MVSSVVNSTGKVRGNAVISSWDAAGPRFIVLGQGTKSPQAMVQPPKRKRRPGHSDFPAVTVTDLVIHYLSDLDLFNFRCIIIKLVSFVAVMGLVCNAWASLVTLHRL